MQSQKNINLSKNYYKKDIHSIKKSHPKKSEYLERELKFGKKFNGKKFKDIISTKEGNEYLNYILKWDKLNEKLAYIIKVVLDLPAEYITTENKLNDDINLIDPNEVFERSNNNDVEPETRNKLLIKSLRAF